MPDAHGSYRRALASVPRGTPGMHIAHNWDALGMRGSGSHDVEFVDCLVPDTALVDGGPWGVWTEGFLASNMAFAMGLSGAFLDRRSGSGLRSVHRQDTPAWLCWSTVGGT